MKWELLAFVLLVLNATARLVDFLLAESAKSKLRNVFYHSWIALESLSLVSAIKRAAILFKLLFSALGGESRSAVFGVYVPLTALLWFALFNGQFPLDFMDNRAMIGGRLLGAVLACWHVLILMAFIFLSHASSVFFVSEIAKSPSLSTALRAWIVDFVLAIVLYVVLYLLIFWCYNQSWSLVPLKVTSIVFTPKVFHLGLVLLVAFLYLLEGLRRFMSILCERLFGLKDSFLLVLASVISVCLALGNAAIRAFENNGQGGKKSEIESHVVANFIGWEKDRALFDPELEKVIRASRADDGGRDRPPESKL